MMRLNQRQDNALRHITLTRHFTKHAEGSVLVTFGDTQVICTASVSDSVPSFLKGSNQGWVTAEYSMLPRATGTRTTREASRGKQGGRTLEIQRLIARSLRQSVDLKALNGYSIIVDCDVIQADGGTRTAAITGGCVALYDALTTLAKIEKIKKPLFRQWISGISIGMVKGIPYLDLAYDEDCQAGTDMNVVMNEAGDFIEIQGTAEQAAFTREQLNDLLSLAEKGCQELINIQKDSIHSQ